MSEAPADAFQSVRDRPNDLHWRLQGFAGSSERHAFTVKARGALALTEFQHDPDWMEQDNAGAGKQTVVLAGATDDGRLQGLLTARFSSELFEYTLGGVAALRRKVPQCTIHQGPVIRSDVASSAEIEACVVALADQVKGHPIVYCSAVPIGSTFHAALTDKTGALRRLFHVMRWGGETVHPKITWQGSNEGYLQSLDGKKRGNVKRAWQKLASSPGFRLARFQRPGEIDEFLRIAADIYARSDRGQDLDLGPLPTPGRERLLRFAAAENAFIGYVLYAKETPIAYRYGYIYGPTLFAISTAYDLSWSEHKPGAVIFFEMLQDLERTKLPITLIDLLPHDSSFKRDRANLIVRTQNFYLFPRTLSWLGLYLPLALIEGAKPIAGDLLQSVRKTLSL